MFRTASAEVLVPVILIVTDCLDPNVYSLFAVTSVPVVVTLVGVPTIVNFSVASSERLFVNVTDVDLLEVNHSVLFALAFKINPSVPEAAALHKDESSVL